MAEKLGRFQSTNPNKRTRLGLKFVNESRSPFLGCNDYFGEAVVVVDSAAHLIELF